MDKANKVWVIAKNSEAIAYLTTAAQTLGNEVTLVFSGAATQAMGADRAYHAGDGSFAQYLPAVIEKIKAEAPEVILTDTSSDGRLAAGLIAAALDAASLVEPSSLDTVQELVSSRMVYGGAANKVEKVTADHVVITLSAGMFESSEKSACASIEELPASGGISFADKQQRTAKKVNLAAAKKIIGVGRGAAGAEHLERAKELAELVNAELGCTRPIAEEEKLMPKETYIGVSGVMCKPSVYIGLGVSGQIQHMVGVNSADVIFAVNKDKDAPIFQQSDYGLVGDIKELLPVIIERLK